MSDSEKPARPAKRGAPSTSKRGVRPGRAAREEGATYLVTDLPIDERPRERLLRSNDPTSLSDGEILAILLRVGVEGMNAIALGNHLLETFKGWRGLMDAPMDELRKVRGLGDAKIAQLKAALEVGRRLVAEGSDRPLLNRPEIVAQLLEVEMALLSREEMYVLVLDTKNMMIGPPRVTHRGTVDGITARVADFFRDALRESARAIILAHNHPSGDPEPSPQDIALTREVARAGKLLDIDVLDHVIVGRGRRDGVPVFTSLKQRGIL
ncbi:MAG: JAB domain-containing protein [Chloroflexota bacterium]|nr:MAG: JAB domain-containing protein [Chloroflexota bacterium]